jgi:hypothetical protein
VLERIAFYRGIRDEKPNQELARELADGDDIAGVAEIAAGLRHKNPNVRSDCVKVLYEIGYLNPGLIAPFVDDFFKLLQSKQKRLVWGTMIALSTIAALKANEIFDNRKLVMKTIDQGSVITMDAGIKTLSIAAAAGDPYREEIIPYLFSKLLTCRLSDMPRHAENIAGCIQPEMKDEFASILKQRQPEMTAPQSARIQKIIKMLT